jgi:hypothetical protein
MDNSLTPQNLGLSTSVLNSLDNYDDFLNFYVQIDQAVNGFSWMKADTLKTMEDRLGSASLKAMSKELGENYSTLVSYIRVSRAFPVDKRDIGASFSLHFQASFADSYNSETKEFMGETRFELRDKALDNNMSTRTLQKEIQAIKEEKTSVDPESFVYKSMAEQIRRGVAILTKLSLDGDVSSQMLLERIKGMIDDRNLFGT